MASSVADRRSTPAKLQGSPEHKNAEAMVGDPTDKDSDPRVLEEEQIATAIPLNDKATTKHDMVENTPEHKNVEAMGGDPTDKDSEPKEKKSKEILY